MFDRFGHELNIGDEVACIVIGKIVDGLGRGKIAAFVRKDIIVELMPAAPGSVTQRISVRGNSVVKNLLPAPPDHLTEAFTEAFSQYLMLVQLSREKFNG